MSTAAASVTLASRAVCRPGDTGPGWVTFADGVIRDCGGDEPPPDAQDLGDAVLAPGFLDLQCNGLGPVDLASADRSEWIALGRTLLRLGTTAYLPTLITAPLDGYEPFLEIAAGLRDDADKDAAAVLGVHLEGPFLGGAPGAHRRDLVRTADVEWLIGLVDQNPGVVRMVTLAPEADPGFTATRALCERGIVVSLGHSLADFGLAHTATDAGARAATHLFNAMGPLDHRAPGLAGAALDDDRITPTLIADLVHVAPPLIRLAVARKRNVALVSDAVAGPLVDGAVRDAAGSLRGAAVTLERAVANVVDLGIPIGRAVELATAVPADLLGLTDRGRIAPGARADLVVLDPRSGSVRRVWKSGGELEMAK